MPSRKGPVHVVTTRRRYKGRLYETHLLRRTYREDGKVKNETVGNLSHLPREVVELVRRVLRGETWAPAGELFEVTASRIHGDTDAVVRAMERLGFRQLLSARLCREADLVMGMVAARVVAPHTKLATTRWWQTRTLPEDLGIERADEDDLYAAMDWLLKRQGAIEKQLAARHLRSGGLALYDLTSSYFEGTTCPLARIGHNRDGKKNKLQVNYGLLTDRWGCPVAVSVYEGNTNDPKTLMPQVRQLQESFGLDRVVLVGDRGMIGQAAVEQLREVEGLSWITALKSGQIRALVEGGALQMGLFDERNLFEWVHPDYPGERLVACRNTELARLRAHKRQALLEATEKELEKVRAMVARGTLRGAGAIGVRVGRVVNKYKVAKHFDLRIEERRFEFHMREQEVAAEAALDGIYVIRTSLSKKQMSAPEVVRSYKALTEVERAFRSMKTIDLKVRPIHHRLADRVRAHIFLCMLAYYVEWHMREAWRSLLFADEDLEAKARRDPVAPAQRSEPAEAKAATHTLPDGTAAHSFRTLLEELSTIVRNTCQAPGRAPAGQAPTFRVVTTPSDKQRHALKLLEAIAA
jgi:hypothetical protein